MKNLKIREEIASYPLRPGGLELTSMAAESCCFGRDSIILDAGCGYGTTSSFLKKRYGSNVVGVDRSMEMLLKCKEINNQLYCDSEEEEQSSSPPPSDPVQATIPDLPFGSSTFDAIFCECVLSLIPDKRKTVNEFCRILKKNGKLLITDLYIKEGEKKIGLSLSGDAGNRSELSVSTRNDGKCTTYENKKKEPSFCLDGALPMEELLELIENEGFTIERYEKRDDILKQFIGQMIFDCRDLTRLPEYLAGVMCNSTPSASCTGNRRKAGYCMIIAHKPV